MRGRSDCGDGGRRPQRGLSSFDLTPSMRQTFTAIVIVLAGLAVASPAPQRADRVLIRKSKRELLLLHGSAVIRTYKIALGAQPVGPKRCEGDNRTPEGIYRIDSRNINSHYHRALHVSYPNAADVASARRLGCRPGGNIMIHGIANGFGAIGAAHRARDWTQGCIAVTNSEIEEIWQRVPNGCVVEIRP